MALSGRRSLNSASAAACAASIAPSRSSISSGRRKKPARPNEIAAGIDAPKSTAYELVNLLLKAGALEYADDDGRVFLGRKLYFLGLVYQQQFDLTRECRAFLLRVAEETRETAQFCMLDGNKYTVVMMKEGIRPFRISLAMSASRCRSRGPHRAACSCRT